MSKSITRRGAVASVAAAAVAASLRPREARAQAAAGARPNVVFILIDDLRWDTFSFMNHPFMQTPNIDRLARDGAHFRNAFVNISLCSPSRACFLSGCEPQRTGVFTNESTDPDPRLPTFPQVLQRNGYETALVGKWHMAPTSEPRPGFDHWLSFRGQGDYLNPTLNENGREFKAEGYMTDLLTDHAVDYLKRDHGGKPFCLCLHHKAVHGPFTPAERHKGLYDVAMEPPANYADDYRDKPSYLRRSMAYGARREEWLKSEGKPILDALPEREWQPKVKSRLDWFRSLQAVDDSVGRVLDTLAELGILDNTMVIFTSDNGYFHGEHRRGDKRLAYEESLRIPLLIRYPAMAQPGAALDPMVLNLDVAPTVLEACGVAPAEQPPMVHARSMAPVLTGSAGAWRDDFLYQYFQEGWMPGLPDIQAVRTRRWKYIVSPQYPTEPELYDLAADPIEMNNLAGEPQTADIQAQLAQRLSVLLQEAEQAAFPPLPPPPPTVLLNFDFAQPGDRVVDLSEQSVPFPLADPPRREVDGRRALVLDGSATPSLEAAQSPTLGGPFWVTVTVRPDQPTGVIASQGGQSNGWTLGVKDGKPHFAIRSEGAASTLIAPEACLGAWTSITGRLQNDHTMSLLVDGRPVAIRKDVGFVQGRPNEPLTFGADLASQVSDEIAGKYVGALGSLVVGVGEER